MSSDIICLRGSSFNDGRLIKDFLKKVMKDEIEITCVKRGRRENEVIIEFCEKQEHSPLVLARENERKIQKLQADFEKMEEFMDATSKTVNSIDFRLMTLESENRPIEEL